MERQTIRIRRVGSITFGVVLIIMGVLFLMQLIFPGLNYVMILKLWPVIFILLGIEVLLGCRYKTFEVLDTKGKIIEQQKMVYDVAAVFLTMVLTGFAICMGLMDWAMKSFPY